MASHLRMETGVAELRGGTAVEQVVLSNGDVEAADLVVVGVGVAPRVELAAAAGLDVDNGVVVDEQLRSSAPDVYAAGDVASAWHPHFQRHLRVEHWANALNQGVTAGANAAGGSDVYDRLPYFFSDQYDLGMEYVGYADPDDAVVVRGSTADREFIAFWQRDGVVTAAMNVNVWDVVDDLKAIITAVAARFDAPPTSPIPACRSPASSPSAQARCTARTPAWTSPRNVNDHASRAIASTILGSHSKASSPIAARIRNVAAPYMPSGNTIAQYDG